MHMEEGCMRTAARARAVSFLSVFLVPLMMLFFQGCTKELLSTRISTAEDRLSHGKAVEEDLKAMNPVLPPSLVARHKLALVMESIQKNEYTFSTVKADLEEIRDNSLNPSYLRTEAGYLLTLVEKMETLHRSAAKAKELNKDNDELKRELEQARKENEEFRKEIESLSYKLKKLEEIHIDSVKRRGKQ